jgi:hypothetical protein
LKIFNRTKIWIIGKLDNDLYQELIFYVVINADHDLKRLIIKCFLVAHVKPENYRRLSGLWRDEGNIPFSSAGAPKSMSLFMCSIRMLKKD